MSILNKIFARLVGANGYESTEAAKKNIEKQLAENKLHSELAKERQEMAKAGKEKGEVVDVDLSEIESKDS